MGERLLRSFNSKLRDEFLNGEIFYSLKEVQVVAERWRIHYNTRRPHSSLGYRPPEPQMPCRTVSEIWNIPPFALRHVRQSTCSDCVAASHTLADLLNAKKLEPASHGPRFTIAV